MKVATLQKILTRVNGFQILFCNGRIIKESILLLIFTSYFQFCFQLIAKRTDKQPIAVNLHQYVRLKN